ARSVIPTRSATSRSRISGSRAIERRTAAWFVTNVQPGGLAVLSVAGLDIHDRSVVHSLSPIHRTRRSVMAATRAAVLEAESKTLGGMRLVVGYAAVAAILAAATSVSIVLGHDEHAAPGIAGFYKSSSACLGSNFKLGQSGQFVDLGSGPSGKLRFRHGHLTGDITCKGGGAAVASDLAVQGKGATAKLAGSIGANQVNASYSEALPAPGTSAKKPPKRSSEETFGRLMLAIAAVILAARLVGTGIRWASQPRVMGEVLAGILLGPTLLW